jgi:cytochrome b
VSDNTRRTKLEQRLDEIEAAIVKLHDQIREARTLAAGENPVGHVIAFWVLSWKNAHGGTYELTKQDATNLKRLVNQHGLEELEGRMIRYFGDSDPRLARQEHPLSIFVARVSSYHVVTDRRGARDVARPAAAGQCLPRLSARGFRIGARRRPLLRGMNSANG